METINKTSMDGKTFYFINAGNKINLQHHPSNQFNGKITWIIPLVHHATLHCQFHQQVLEVATIGLTQQ